MIKPRAKVDLAKPNTIRSALAAVDIEKSELEEMLYKEQLYKEPLPDGTSKATVRKEIATLERTSLTLQDKLLESIKEHETVRIYENPRGQEIILEVTDPGTIIQGSTLSLTGGNVFTLTPTSIKWLIQELSVL